MSQPDPELVSHNIDEDWRIKLSATATAQLYVNGQAYGSEYTVPTDREAVISLRIEEHDIPPSP